MTRRTPSYGGRIEAERLRRVHHTPARYGIEYRNEHLPDGTVVPIAVCDYCDDGDTPFEGRHLVPDPEGIEGTWSVPCPRS